MGTFVAGRKYSLEELRSDHRQLYRKLLFDYMQQPGEYFPYVRLAGEAMMTDLGVDGELLNHAARYCNL